jgi:transposase
MAAKLTNGEIKKRLIRLNNLERLHTAQLKRNKKLIKDIQAFKEQIKLLKERDKEKDGIIVELKLQIEELQRMVFGRRRKKKKEAEDEDNDKQKPRKPAERSLDSYHRKQPTEESVTNEEHRGIDSCPDCKTPLERMETRVFYVEDIVLPKEDTAPLKTVTKRTIERGWCPSCRKWVSAIPLPTTSVIIGPKVKVYICYLSILIRLSFEQIHTLLKTTYDFDISDGEIANILHKEADALKPEYEALKDRIRAQRGVHYDETGHPVQKGAQGNYAWVVSGTETDEAAFLCGVSRGGGNVDILRGEDDDAHVGITDDYVGYHKKFKKHGLCWSHPNRKFRDLKNSDKLDTATREHCRMIYGAFSELYDQVRVVCKTPFILSERLQRKEELAVIFDSVAASHPNDQPKIAKIKQRLRQQKELYFTCVINEGIPPDNNKAERSLRPLVIKRKISFGSKTERGAETVSILASVILSLWWTKPRTFFQELLVVRGV